MIVDAHKRNSFLFFFVYFISITILYDFIMGRRSSGLDSENQLGIVKLWKWDEVSA